MQSDWLFRVVADKLTYLFGTSHRLAVDRQNSVAGFQSRFGCRRAFFNTADNDGQVSVVRQKIQRPKGLALIGSGSWFDRQRDLLACAVNHQRNWFPRREQRIIADSSPARMLSAIKSDNAIAGLQPCRLSGATRHDMPDDGRRGNLHAVDHCTQERNRNRGQDIHDRARDRHQDALPTRTQIETFAGGNVRRALAFDRRIRLVAPEFHVTAERYQRHSIIRMTFFLSEQAGAKPKRKGFDSNFQQLSDDEVTKLVKRDRCAKNENEGENSDNATL